MAAWTRCLNQQNSRQLQSSSVLRSSRSFERNRLEGVCHKDAKGGKHIYSLCNRGNDLQVNGLKRLDHEVKENILGPLNPANMGALQFKHRNSYFHQIMISIRYRI
jgi:hypothetical protein